VASLEHLREQYEAGDNNGAPTSSSRYGSFWSSGTRRISKTQDVYMGRRIVDGSVAWALEGLFDAGGPDDEDPGPGSPAVVS